MCFEKLNWFFHVEDNVLIGYDTDPDDVDVMYGIFHRHTDKYYSVLMVKPTDDEVVYDVVYQGTVEECDLYFSKLCNLYEVV